jgi:predicted nucleic acid-binding protein
MKVVLDTSAAIRVVTGRDDEGVLGGALMDASQVLVPDIFVAEAANAIWKLATFAGVDAEQADATLETALALPDIVAPSAPLAAEALELALRVGHPVYDLLFLVLARRHAATLLTCDRRLAALARGHGLRVAP